MPFVKGVGGGERVGGRGRAGEEGRKEGERRGESSRRRRRSEATGCLVKVRGFLASILAAREKKTKTLTPSITIAITRLSQPEKKKIND